MAKYTIGVDFGTLSARALLVNAKTGEEIATANFTYPNGVMDQTLPCGTKLPLDWALQNPKDYLDALANIIPTLLKNGNITANDVIGIATDFTACTILPVKADGTPLCFLPQYKNTPHAYVKLWKHHAAQPQANKLNKIASDMGEKWLARYGGKISSEWLIPKIWQVLEDAPDIYYAADFFIELADWIVWQLTGVQTRNACTAGYKGMWNKREGYPSKDFFKALDPRLESVVSDKLNCPISPIGSKAGEINAFASELTGLNKGTAVTVGVIDAHVTMPAVGINKAGQLLAIMGTSTCHILMSNQEQMVPGMCGVTEDGVMPGFFGYEAGQSCVGDHFAWFMKNLVPASYAKAAEQEGIDLFKYMDKKAAALQIGESGLVALDWWNGNRSTLVDVDLTGVFLGMTLQTKPEEMYRALIEATAYGTRKIIDTFEHNGVPIDEFYASGGISQKNPMMMQIYADVTRKTIKIAGSSEGPALGGAIFASVAAGSAVGGYDNIFEAGQKMGKLKDTVYTPIEDNVRKYNALYEEYELLYNYFGKGTNDVMKRLKQYKTGNF